MQEINLLQTRSRISSTSHAWERHSTFLLTVFSMILFLLIAAGGGLLYMKSNIEKEITVVTESNTDLEKQLAEKETSLKDAKAFQAQLTNLQTLVDQHIYTSALIREIEAMTYQKAKYVSVTTSSDGKVNVEGNAASYTDLGKLLLGLSTSGQFSKVKLLSASPSSDETSSYTFAIQLTANRAIFYKK